MNGTSNPEVSNKHIEDNNATSQYRVSSNLDKNINCSSSISNNSRLNTDYSQIESKASHMNNNSKQKNSKLNGYSYNNKFSIVNGVILNPNSTPDCDCEIKSNNFSETANGSIESSTTNSENGVSVSR